MNWWNATVPLWQLIVLATVYTIYKEVIKLTLKTLLKLRRERNANRQHCQILEKPDNKDT